MPYLILQKTLTGLGTVHRANEGNFFFKCNIPALNNISLWGVLRQWDWPLFWKPGPSCASISNRSISDATTVAVRYSLFPPNVHTWPALHLQGQVCQDCKLDFRQHPLQHWHPSGTSSQPILYTLFTYDHVASNNKRHCEGYGQHHSDRTHPRRGQDPTGVIQDRGGQSGVTVWRQQPHPQQGQEERDNGGHEKEGEPQPPPFSQNYTRRSFGHLTVESWLRKLRRRMFAMLTEILSSV